MPSSSDSLTALAGLRTGFRRVLGAPLLVIGLILFALAWIVFVVGVDWIFGGIPPDR